MLRDLVAHKRHADSALLSAIAPNDAAANDPEIRELLHHMLLANRFWLCTIIGLPFVVEDEARKAHSFHELAERYAATQTQESAWFAAAADDECARILIDARIPGGKCSVAQAFLQVCLHSQGHRAQSAKLLRRHGVEPPATDFILWLARDRT
jgi:uncharacterized damage-inducible protein DinB